MFSIIAKSKIHTHVLQINLIDVWLLTGKISFTSTKCDFSILAFFHGSPTDGWMKAGKEKEFNLSLEESKASSTVTMVMSDFFS